MSSRVPPKPVGDSTLHSWARAVHEEVFVVLRRITATNGRVRRTQRGIVITSDATGKKTTSTAGVVFRGEWTANPDQPYDQQHMVKVSGGISAGTYISVIDGNAAVPSSGSPGWSQLASGDALGYWI